MGRQFWSLLVFPYVSIPLHLSNIFCGNTELFSAGAIFLRLPKICILHFRGHDVMQSIRRVPDEHTFGE